MLYGHAPMLPSMFLVSGIRDTSSAQDEELRRQVSTQSETKAIQLQGNIGDPVLVRTAPHTNKLQPKWTPGFYILESDATVTAYRMALSKNSSCEQRSCRRGRRQLVEQYSRLDY